MEGKCAICGREETLTKHHLIPRTRHHNKRNKREFDRATVKRVIGICRPCHSQIHLLLTEKELEREYRTIESLRAHPELMKFAAWIATKPRSFRCRADGRAVGAGKHTPPECWRQRPRRRELSAPLTAACFLSVFLRATKIKTRDVCAPRI